jgi:hypothetical protein
VRARGAGVAIRRLWPRHIVTSLPAQGITPSRFERLATMNKTLRMGFALATITSLFGCANPGKVTGGGSVVGDDGKKLATFAVHADTCSGDLNAAQGRMNWVDQARDVKMNGTMTAHAVCVSEQDWQGTWIAPDCEWCAGSLGYGAELAYFTYRSTNPRAPGDGVGVACVKDNGEGSNNLDGDRLILNVGSGVYAGYGASGRVRGNVQSHACGE